MAKKLHHVIVSETIERHYEVDAANKYDASFQVATGIMSDPPLEPTRVVSVKTSTHVSAAVAEGDE